MEDKVLTYLNCNEELKKKLHIFKEAFIMYYGEQCREEIERKFSNAHLIGYYLPEDIRIHFLEEIEKEKTNEYMKKILSETTLDITQKELCDTYSFDCISILPVTNLINFFDTFFKSPEERKEEFINEGYGYLSGIIKNITETEYREIFRTKLIPSKYDRLPGYFRNNFEYFINEENIERIYQKSFKDASKILKKFDSEINEENFEKKIREPQFIELIKVTEKIKLAIEDYNNYMSRYKEYYDEARRTEKLQNSIDEKLTKEFILENQDILPEEKRDCLEEALNKKDFLYIDEYVENVLGRSLYSVLDILYFSSEKEAILNSNKTTDYEKDTIRSYRVDYFKSIGIDLGNDYSKYENSEEARKVWPTCERIDRLSESRNKYLNRYNIEYYHSTDNYKRIKKELDEIGLIDQDSFNAEKYVQQMTCVSANFRRTKNGIEQYPLVIINFGCVDNNNKDHDIVHELNHLFELMIQSDGKVYSGVCGWDLLSGTINDSNEETNTLEKDEKRQYELFNEIINELIAQDICEIMHQNNMYVFDEPEKSKYRGITSYEDSIILIKDFFKEFKDKIIESRRNGNIQIIFNEVGKENFDELNNLFPIFMEKFGGFKKYTLIGCLRNKEDNEMTREYFEILEKRDIILNKMRMHSASKMNTETEQLSNPNVMN